MVTGYDLDPNSPSAIAAQAEYERLSRDAASLPGARLNLPYGPHPLQRLDLFPAGAGAPALVFFHGGYWRAGSKETRRFPALEWLPRGVSWVSVSYRLVPEYSLADAVQDARDVVSWLAMCGGEYGIDPARIHLTGNSAGAHLAAMACACDRNACPEIASLTVISGLFELAPLMQTPVNEWLRLSGTSARELSPISHLPPAHIPLRVGWGGAETAEFAFQSRLYADACRTNGNPVSFFESPGKDHFQIIGEFGAPETPVFNALAEQIGGSRTGGRTPQ